MGLHCCHCQRPPRVKEHTEKLCLHPFCSPQTNHIVIPLLPRPYWWNLKVSRFATDINSRHWEQWCEEGRHKVENKRVLYVQWGPCSENQGKGGLCSHTADGNESICTHTQADSSQTLQELISTATLSEGLARCQRLKVTSYIVSQTHVKHILLLSFKNSAGDCLLYIYISIYCSLLYSTTIKGDVTPPAMAPSLHPFDSIMGGFIGWSSGEYFHTHHNLE